jgi:hypothetical protein
MILQRFKSNEPRNFDPEGVDRRHVCRMQPRRCKTYGSNGYLKSAKKWDEKLRPWESFNGLPFRRS